MKRWILAFFLALVPVLGVMAPAVAHATTVSGGALTSGKPVKATISIAGQTIQYTFAAKAHKHVTFQVTNFNFSDNGFGGDLYLNFYEPGSSSTYTSCYFSDNGYCDFTTPIGGTWKAVVDPNGGSVGSMTLTFANDVATKALTAGTPVATTIRFQGQNANYTFPATAKAHVTFQVTNFNFSDNGSGGDLYLNFRQPGSSSTYTSCYFSDNGYCDFTPPLTGTWSVVLDANGASTGSLMLTFADDVASQPLTSGTAVSTTIVFQGQNAGYTFAATQNKHVTFQVTNFNFSDNGSGGDLYLNFFEPGSSAVYTSCYFSANGYCDFTPPLTGTWSAVLDANGASTGNLTLTFANDVATKALTAGTPVATTIRFQGQNANYTFPAKVNTNIAFQVSKFNLSDNGSGGDAYLNFYEPGSSAVYTSCYFSANGSCTIKPPVGGTWKATLDPNGASVGSLTLTMG
jgi:hypothetical protein